MGFVDKTLISSLSLDLKKINYHSKLENCEDRSIVGRPKFCKTCCKPCRRICPRVIAKYKTQFKVRQGHGRSDNFVFVSAGYIVELYLWVQKCIFKRLLTDDFLKSIVASATLFAIGIKITSELNAWSLSRIVDQ